MLEDHDPNVTVFMSGDHDPNVTVFMSGDHDPNVTVFMSGDHDPNVTVFMSGVYVLMCPCQRGKKKAKEKKTISFVIFHPRKSNVRDRTSILGLLSPSVDRSKDENLLAQVDKQILKPIHVHNGIAFTPAPYTP
ncbi:hypothetical protein BgiBS90_017031 [Biomphalaria glabrata]|nr:hypothetical protein BgiBS90_017031 [Biomphalaria glabrata]